MRTRIEPTAPSASKSAGGKDEPGCTLVYTGTLYRRRKGNAIALVEEPPPRPAPQGPSRQAIMLALAHKLQQAIDTGKVKDRAEVARRLGVTRARVTQIMDLALLPVAEQERVLGIQESLTCSHAAEHHGNGTASQVNGVCAGTERTPEFEACSTDN